MIVLSLQQPYASLMFIPAFPGSLKMAKSAETRGWGTDHRGELFIHASKAWKKQYKALCQQEPFCRYITEPDKLPLGAIIGVVNLTEIFTTEYFKTLEVIPGIPRVEKQYMENEIAFGDYSAGRKAWVCTGAKLLAEPYPIKGKLSLWGGATESGSYTITPAQEHEIRMRLI